MDRSLSSPFHLALSLFFPWLALPPPATISSSPTKAARSSAPPATRSSAPLMAVRSSAPPATRSSAPPATRSSAFRIMGLLLIPSYFGAHTSDVREVAFALDAIRRGATMKDDLDVLANENVEDAIHVSRMLGFHF